MNMIECIRLAIDSIKVNKLRSFLTMLGIIIGISSVITITTIGTSLQETLASTMNSLGGTNLIYAYIEQNYDESNDTDNVSEDSEEESEDTSEEMPVLEDSDTLTFNDLDKLKKNFSDKINYVIASKELSNGSYNGSKNKVNVSLVATTPGYLQANNIDIIFGRDINSKDIDGYKSTAVVSDLFVKYGLNGKNPIGSEINMSMEDNSVITLHIVGIYKYDKQKFGMQGQKISDKEIVTPLLFPLTTASSFTQNEDQTSGISYFQITAKPGVNPTSLSGEIEEYFSNTKYKNNKNWKISCYDMASELGIINKTLTIMTIAISVIAAISLLVGGVGVMNIMLVSVVERTREIGIRKALGAKDKYIQRQFLTEAIVICLIGGIIGIIIGMLNGFLLSKVAAFIVSQYAHDIGSMLHVIVKPSTTAIIISVLFSMLIGIIFGSYPAKRAAKMSPIDALRYE